MTSILHHYKWLFISSCSVRFNFFMKETYTLHFDNQPIRSVNNINGFKLVFLAKYKKQKASAAMLNPY